MLMALPITFPTIEKAISSGNSYLNIAGQIIPFPSELSKIKSEIDHSKYILSLSPGWDEDKGLPIAKDLWTAAVMFLANYARFIFQQFYMVVETPEINPCPNGTLDFSWDAPKAQMLANVRMEEEAMVVYFYGDLYHNKMPIKGKVPVETVEEHLAYWMKNLAR